MIMSFDFEKLNFFREHEKLCDVTIQVQERTFPCHRVILGLASEFFELMFAGNFAEKCSNNVVLHDMDADIFEKILKFMYTGEEVSITVKNVYLLLRTSEFLKIPHIENCCIKYITENVFSFSVDEVLRIFNYACAMNTTSLIDTMSQFIIKFFYNYSQSDTILEIPLDSLKILLTRYRLPLPTFKMLPMLDENILLDVVIRWVRYNRKQRLGCFRELVELVDYERISVEYIEFLLKELKIDSPVTEIREDRSIFKKYLTDYFENIAHDTSIVKMESADDTEESSAPYLDPQFPALHVYVDVSGTANRKRWVFSISKFKPDWFISSTSLSERPSKLSKKESSMYEPKSRDWNDFYIRNIIVKNTDYLYCLETNSRYKSVRTQHQSFYAYPSVERSSSDRLFLREPPIFIPSFDMCALRSRIYLYDNNVHYNSGKYSRQLPKGSRFTHDEIHTGIFCYRCTEDKWYPVPNMKVKMSGASLAAVKESIYLIGGRDMNGEFHKGYVQSFDRRTKTWFKIAKTNNLYFHARSCSVNDKIYICDGKNMEVYDPNAGKWEEIAPVDKILKRCGDFIMLPYEKQLWFVSGSSKGKISRASGSTEMIEPVVSTYDPISEIWYSSNALKEEIDRTVMSFNEYTSTHAGNPVVKDAIVYKPLEPWVMP